MSLEPELKGANNNLTVQIESLLSGVEHQGLKQALAGMHIAGILEKFPNLLPVVREIDDLTNTLTGGGCQVEIYLDESQSSGLEVVIRDKAGNVVQPLDQAEAIGSSASVELKLKRLASNLREAAGTQHLLEIGQVNENVTTNEFNHLEEVYYDLADVKSNPGDYVMGINNIFRGLRLLGDTSRIDKDKLNKLREGLETFLRGIILNKDIKFKREGQSAEVKGNVKEVVVSLSPMSVKILIEIDGVYENYYLGDFEGEGEILEEIVEIDLDSGVVL